MSTLPSNCSKCNLHYSDFRCGFTFQDVFEQFWKPGKPAAEWPNIRRKLILGRLWELKQNLWAEHLEYCQGPTSDEPLYQEEY